MTMRVILAIALAIPVTAFAQVQAPRTTRGCVLADDHAGIISASGIVERQTFPAPDRRVERFYLLRLPKPTCVEDGRQGLLAGRERVTVIQIMASRADDARLWRFRGKPITIRGQAMVRNTGHHHTPLLIVDPIRIMR